MFFLPLIVEAPVSSYGDWVCWFLEDVYIFKLVIASMY